MGLARLLDVLDDWLFPEDVLCLCCDRALGEDAQDGVCPACIRALERLNRRQETWEAQAAEKAPPEIAYIHSAFPYEGQARVLIWRLKYESVRAACVPLAKQMAFLPTGEEELLVPIPTDRRRRLRRGFNQAELLARHMGRELGVEVRPVLTRVRRSRPQTGLSAEERRSNLRGCMAAEESVSGRRVLLVDDVYTTGATAQEAARALLEAGALSVGVLTAARASGMDEPGDPFDPALWARRSGSQGTSTGDF